MATKKKAKVRLVAVRWWVLLDGIPFGGAADRGSRARPGRRFEAWDFYARHMAHGATRAAAVAALVRAAKEKKP